MDHPTVGVNVADRTKRHEFTSRQIGTQVTVFDAAARAKRLVVEAGIVDEDERYGIDRTLNAATLTYVAAVITTLWTLLYFLVRSGLLGGRDD